MDLKIDHAKVAKIIRIYYCDDAAGYLTYEILDGILDIQHTVINPEFRGKGFGRVLVEFVICFAENENLSVFPSCSYAKHIIDERNRL